MSTKKQNTSAAAPAKTTLQQQVNTGLAGGRYVLKDGKAVLATDLPAAPKTESEEK
jgi:hypothetical protein